MDIFVTFYTNQDKPILAWGLKFHKYKYDHCSIILKTDDYPMLSLHVSTENFPKFIREKTLHKVMEPRKIFYIGKTSTSPEEVVALLERGKKFSIVKIALWYYLTRWFLKWEPKWICTTVVCRILNKCKLYNTHCVIPDKLEKELSDADSFYSWTSGDG